MRRGVVDLKTSCKILNITNNNIIILNIRNSDKVLDKVSYYTDNFRIKIAEL
jgi:hypothetical protein